MITSGRAPSSTAAVITSSTKRMKRTFWSLVSRASRAGEILAMVDRASLNGAQAVAA